MQESNVTLVVSITVQLPSQIAIYLIWAIRSGKKPFARRPDARGEPRANLQVPVGLFEKQ